MRIYPNKKQQLWHVVKMDWAVKHESHQLCEFVNNHGLLPEGDCKWFFKQDSLGTSSQHVVAVDVITYSTMNTSNGTISEV